MKKLFSILAVSLLVLSTTAQQGYRYSVVPGSDNTYTIPHKEIAAVTYAATKTLSPTMEETTYNFAQLTGAMTVSVTVTPCYTGDKMTCLFNADGTDRVVTFSTGFSASGTLTVTASTYAAISFVFNGAAWYEVCRENLTSGTSSTFLAGNGTVGAPAFSFAADADNGLYRIGANNIGVAAAGAKVLDVSATGLGVTGSVTVSTDVSLAKEVDHIVSVATTTTAATAGGKLTNQAGTGATSGTGGAIELIGGTAGATAGASGGAVNITGGAQGAGLGITGAINITTPNATGGAAGNINITPGTSSSTTIAPLTIMSKGKVWKPLTGTVATGGTATGIQVAGGLLTITGATGNVTLPTAAQITTAIGATPAGTVVDFIVNAVGMTATNTVTIVVGTNITVMSAPPITGGGTLTVTQDTQVVGYFRLIYDTATTCKISRIN